MSAGTRTGVAPGEAETRPSPEWGARKKPARDQAREDPDGPSFCRRNFSACAGSGGRPGIPDERHGRPPRSLPFLPPPSFAELLLPPTDEERGWASRMSGRRERGASDGRSEAEPHAEGPRTGVRRASGPARDAKRRRRRSHLDFFLCPDSNRRDANGSAQLEGMASEHAGRDPGAAAASEKTTRVSLLEFPDSIGRAGWIGVTGGSARPLLTTSSLFSCSPVSEAPHCPSRPRACGASERVASGARLTPLRAVVHAPGRSVSSRQDAFLGGPQADCADVDTGGTFQRRQPGLPFRREEAGPRREAENEAETDPQESPETANRLRGREARRASSESGPDRETQSQMHASPGWSGSQKRAKRRRRRGAPSGSRDRAGEIEGRGQLTGAGCLLSGAQAVESLCGVKKGEKAPRVGFEDSPGSGGATRAETNRARVDERTRGAREPEASRVPPTGRSSCHSAELSRSRVPVPASPLLRATAFNASRDGETWRDAQSRQSPLECVSECLDPGFRRFSDCQSRRDKAREREDRSVQAVHCSDSGRKAGMCVPRVLDAMQSPRSGECSEAHAGRGLQSRSFSSSLPPWTARCTLQEVPTRSAPSAEPSLKKTRRIPFRIVGGRVVQNGFSFSGSRCIALRPQGREVREGGSPSTEGSGVTPREDVQGRVEAERLGGSVAGRASEEKEARTSSALGTQSKGEQRTPGRFEDVLLRLAADSRLSLRALQKQFLGSRYGDASRWEKREEAVNDGEEGVDSLGEKGILADEAQARSLVRKRTNVSSPLGGFARTEATCPPKENGEGGMTEDLKPPFLTTKTGEPDGRHVGVNPNSEDALTRRQQAGDPPHGDETGRREAEAALRDSLRAFLRRRRLKRAATGKRILVALGRLGSFQASLPSSRFHMTGGEKEESGPSSVEEEPWYSGEAGNILDFPLLDAFGDPVHLTSGATPWPKTRLCPETLQERIVALHLWEPCFASLQTGSTEEEEKLLKELWDVERRNRREGLCESEASPQFHLSRPKGLENAVGVPEDRGNSRSAAAEDTQKDKGTVASRCEDSETTDVPGSEPRGFSSNRERRLFAEGEPRRAVESEAICPVLSEMSYGVSSCLVMHLCFWAACRLLLARGPRVSAKALGGEAVARIASFLPALSRFLGSLHSEAVDLARPAGLGEGTEEKKKEGVEGRMEMRHRWDAQDSGGSGRVHCLNSSAPDAAKANEGPPGLATGRGLSGSHGECEVGHQKKLMRNAKRKPNTQPACRVVDGTAKLAPIPTPILPLPHHHFDPTSNPGFTGYFRSRTEDITILGRLVQIIN
ncbi:conserved hypothetical protein [Neospora caninum Liverpool]|uniref:Uncharacterized protein n=1 Tax=Neospora caninum (strain Liverpool) TaxID=572307 RepID=F0VEN7_NEOCL|nr:conserved hypothetical protein [Neospora caninum Liverpool]CBZ52181.1 conserved hypothetical protein [Neospora caninum Liverpool]|eukprot:XP_003882213.1 conserved hypothetical protein [Neospora caninum Liverpool]